MESGAFAAGGKAFPEKWAHMFALWCAIVALALQPLEEGTQPKRKIERLVRYRAAIQDLLQRFDRTGSRAAKLEVMAEVERLSFEEVCDSLRSNHEARFVM
jgi:hypothetical protein